MRIKPKGIGLLLLTLVGILFAANGVCAQDDTTPKKRIQSPATVRGFIGGESHDSYVIRARKGQTLTVDLSWRLKDDNRAEFTVTESSNFFSGEQVKFGTSSDNGKRWSGKVPRTGNYYIYVVGHPTARYKLLVTVK